MNVKSVLMHPLELPTLIKSRITRRRHIRAGARLNSLWSNQDFILDNVEAAINFDLKVFENSQEAEHQIRRYGNMKAILKEIQEKRIPGDIVEFGTWQGTSLLLFNRAIGADAQNRKLVGIDSFEGLPQNSHDWRKGQFNDTSLTAVHQKLSTRIQNEQQFHLIKGWFEDQYVVRELYSIVSQISIVHFDSDLGASTTTALEMIEHYLIGRKDPIYFLFDDWGCHPDEVPEAFNSWLARVSTEFKLRAEKISTTRFTRYYRITFDD